MSSSGPIRALVVMAALALPASAGAQALNLRYGVASFGEVDPLRDAGLLAACGTDYIEPALSRTPARSDAVRDDQLQKRAAAKIPIETMNWFLPGTEIKLTGPDVDETKVRDYLERSLALAEKLGAKVIVFGSPG